MLLNNNVQPKFDVYYQGAKLIDFLSKSKNKTIDFFDVYQEFNIKNKISMSLFMLTIDWLFIIGLVNNVENGKIEKCF